MHSFRLKSIAALTLALLLAVSGCRAQTPEGLSPELARRIAVLIRSRAGLPFTYDVKVTEKRKSTLPGYDEVVVMVGDAGKPAKPITFLLSTDQKTLAQLTTFDLTKNPRETVSDAGRPARGGTETAPVRIVVFDDLECPFCAKMHAELFPALLNRYGDKVRISYKDFPLSQIHPWALHAAIDSDCLGAQNTAAYWSYVDYLHAHANEIGGQEKSLTSAKQQLDKIATDTGRSSKLDSTKLQACLTKQDETPVNAGLREGEQLAVNGVPALFINGEQINGAAPIEFVYRAVDAALLAQGVTPPPPVPLPDLNSPPPASTAPAAPAASR